MAYRKPYMFDLEHGEKRSEYHVFENISSPELLATEIDSGPRKIVCFNRS